MACASKLFRYWRWCQTWHVPGFEAGAKPFFIQNPHSCKKIKISFSILGPSGPYLDLSPTPYFQSPD